MRCRWAIVVLPALLHAQPAFAYRTLQDDRELDARDAVVWSEPEVTVELVTSSLSDAEREVVERELRAALAAWTRIECSSLAYSYDASRHLPDATPNDGRNTVQWVPTGWATQFDPAAAATTDLQLMRNPSVTVQVGSSRDLVIVPTARGRAA